ncbi:TM0106 family RecB-like putative nuclease [Microbacterium suaedae]|uniref:TM0106 family RecB-like putative nuclease n=1 Tax=Microbacterium suaedae TaxID=2067813 RepID=UPI000DAC2E44|nr:bifunctional RecB family nuclease/DEAD/DEAH box helicase [Microbacterium suaedae]
MRITRDDHRLIWSASDLKAAAECEFAWLRRIDAKLGRCEPVDDPDDAMLERAAQMGDAHEARVLSEYRAQHGDAVVEIARVSSADADGLAEAVRETIAALKDPMAQVVFQGAFSSGDFVGFADFLIRDAAGGWRVQDTKLARTARSTALMQLAAYVDQLDRGGVARSDEVDLLLGDGSTSTHDVRDLLPLFEVHRERLRALVADRRVETGAATEAIAWGDARGGLGVRSCGRCVVCELEVQAHRDVLLVAGMRPTQRDRLRAGGIETIDQLAEAREKPARLSDDVFEALRTQARLQVETEREGGAAPLYEVVNPAALSAMPRPDHGDIFFDFEGDPLFSERGSDGRTSWGIDYLFGWVDLREQYTPIWAHDLAAERRALERFCDFVAARRRAHPQMHIYHYAPYEPSHLAAMAARHGVREAEVDRMLRDELFVDLYPIVKHALRVGSRSYSIKKLEPLYMGGDVRTQDVQKGDDSIVRYVEARGLLEAGRPSEAQAILEDLADYNRYDCVSTRRLRDWLVERAREARVLPAAPDDRLSDVYEPSPRATALTARADELADARGEGEPVSNDEQALRLAAAAIDYYPREARSFWQNHFERLREPVSLWGETKDVVVVDIRRSELVDDWHIPDGSRAERRRVELRGDLAPGTRLGVGSSPYALYPAPAPFPNEASQRWIHVPREVTVVEVLDDGVVVDEYAVDGQTWRELPVALTPPSPPRAGAQQGAIDEWADTLLKGENHVGSADGAFPIDAATDILRTLRADHHSGRVVSSAIGSDIDAIVFSLLSVPTYLAVQGPPGTGKTYVGSHVIARLVNDHGWKVGVVAQSHAVVENMLDRVVAAGVPAAHVGKTLKGGARADGQSFTVLPRGGLAAYQRGRSKGYVVGGTAWDFANVTRVDRRGLDLLVVDEAGQFSLASTIAVSMAARRLLLLGDPQQLPQVSQGTHTAPVDTSALGWLMRGSAVLPDGHGYFLAQTWRLHPEVARPVSELSYSGRLRARSGAELRSIEGVEPGVHPVPISHRGNATASPEEAEAVLQIVQETIGRAFVDIDIDDEQAASPRAPRALTQSDVIVVAPYNAQQQLVEQTLAQGGFPHVRVGTVDKFQGQEAAVAILTLAASSGRDAPRGPEFLLLQNRLNVGISRAKVAAHVVYSPALLDDLPFHADSVARLSAFARLVDRG